MALKRNFIYAGQTLPDPDSSMSAEDVKLFYAASQHPELTNAVIVFNDPKGDVQQYEFKEKAKTAGAASGRASTGSGDKTQNIEFKPSVGRKG